MSVFNEELTSYTLKLILLRLLTENMVDIFVGVEQNQFHLHRDLLCDRSDYFKACFERSFKEAQQGQLFLQEDDTGSFDLFVKWLYGAPLKKIGSHDDLLVFLALVVLVKKLCLEYLQNEAMDHILKFHRVSASDFGHQYLHYIYQNTSDQDRIRTYLVAHAAWMIVWKQGAELTAEYQRLIRDGGDLAVDLTNWLLHYHTDPRRASNCAYHKHDFTPTCSVPSR